MPGLTPPTFATITSEEELTEWIDDKSKQLLCVFDMHLSWTGHCQSLTPIFREYAKKYEIECCPERLAVLTLDVSKVEFDNVLGTSKELSKKGCRPLFVLVRNGKLVAKVEDTDAPKLEALITKHLPPPPAAVESEFDEEAES